MIRQLAIAGVVALTISLSGTAHATDQDPPIRTEWMPCINDEAGPGFNCVWDGKHQGNGIGDSFYVNGEGKVRVLPHHIAHSLTAPENRREYVPCDWPVTSDPVSCIWEESVWLGRSGGDHPIPTDVARFLLYRDTV